MQAEADLTSLERQLADARAEALAQFGTEDLAELRAMLGRLREENVARRRDYEAHLERIEAALREIEAAHAAAAA